ncbi:MAG: hypothetical protein ABI045_02585 [Flavobacteriales bacterium]
MGSTSAIRGIVSLFGLSVGHESKAMHGKIFTIEHYQNQIFQGLPECFRVILYYSLILT